MDPATFDPYYLDPDLIEVELHVPSSVVCLYGALLRHFLHVKVSAFIDFLISDPNVARSLPLM